MMKSKARKSYILLYGGIFIYSLSTVMNKFASGHDFPNKWFCLFYGMGLLCLMIYAVIWQQVLKVVPLNTAYANRSLALIVSMFWGWLFFEEAIKWNMLAGAAIILLGVNLVVKSDEL